MAEDETARAFNDLSSADQWVEINKHAFSQLARIVRSSGSLMLAPCVTMNRSAL